MSDRPFISVERGQELLGVLCDQHADRLLDAELDAFESMREQNSLSQRQLVWIQKSALRLDIIEQPVTNEWSSRTLQERERIRGRDVPTPAVLLNRPLAPPGRKPKK